MVLLTVGEGIDLVFMTLILGYLFKDVFKRPAQAPAHKQVYSMEKGPNGTYEFSHGAPFLDLKDYLSSGKRRWHDDLLFAMAVTAPAIALHEFAHKGAALLAGLSATFHASYGGLFMGLLMKWVLGFIVFVPAYVSIGVPQAVQGIAAAAPSQLTFGLIALAGPLVNLALWLLARFALENHLLKGYEHALVLVRELNRMLFFFNMLPIPGFDGFQFYSALFRTIF